MVFPVSGAICWRGFFAFDSCLYLFLCFTVSLLVCVFVTQADFATLGAGRGEGLGEVGRDQGIFVVFAFVCFCFMVFVALETGRDRGGTLWRFALLFVKSDEDARCNDFGLTHFSGANEVD